MTNLLKGHSASGRECPQLLGMTKFPVELSIRPRLWRNIERNQWLSSQQTIGIHPWIAHSAQEKPTETSQNPPGTRFAWLKSMQSHIRFNKS